MDDYSIKIDSLRVGFSNAVLIANGSNSILVDTGVKGDLNYFAKWFKKYNLVPEDIKLIILTHVHYDHTGNLKSLVNLTGAKVLVHKNEFENLKNGFIEIPIGQGSYTRIVSKLGKKIYPKYASPKPFTADLINENEFDLNEYGLFGKIISTPGHTAGSQSVLLGKTLISGDTFIHLPNGVIFPHFCNDPETLLVTWQKLYDSGIEEIYPGHGKPLNVEQTYPVFEKWKKKFI